ncbi:DUF2141 domain-containing protein [Novosphingobium sp. AP12]|uniref:DUF2141 domain-containing protein n=1 Tax=Novosphingobium sp. AP12 TaxID=1144305 RepID=UPI000271F11A|nr:DUF2141 domain-containing protein [Novosphingobium sp. AP12]EJL33208.1 hypothetical protein PMI02_01243 [Novosphingobium sp. AP12]
MTAAVLTATGVPPTLVQVTVTELRSDKGQVLACLTTRADAFPDCDKDPLARKLTVPAAAEVHLDFGAVPAGRYAVSVIHDENGNGKLDTRLGIPREGYGFSRDAAVRMGPPKFEHAAVDVAGETVRLAIRMRYLL